MFSILEAIAILLPIFISVSNADVFFTNQTVPAGLSNGCTNALMQNINCHHIVTGLYPDEFYTPAALELACTDVCANQLFRYRTRVSEQCVGQTWNPGDRPVPITMLIDQLRYNYDLVCLKDNGRFCNQVASSIAKSEETMMAVPTGVSSTAGCDLCLVKSMRHRAGSPFSEGPVLRESSLYQSLTSRCGIASLPISTTVYEYMPSTEVQPTAPAPTRCVSPAREYEIRPGDDCHNIAKAQGIGTAWLLTDNDLSASCADFPTSGKLCIRNSCSVYTVKTGDTCKSIALSHNIEEAQLISWNPSINIGCYNLQAMVGFEVCISVPGQPYHTPTTTTVLAPITPTEPAPVPTDVAEGTISHCGRFYKAELGDFCNMLTLKFGISLPDFIFLNPAINENCTNLIVDESYCVQAVGDINTYSGHPGSSTLIGTAPITDDADSLPLATETPRAPPASTQLAEGTIDDCETYFNSSMILEADLTRTYFGNYCEFAAAVFDISLEELGVWNQGLGNVSESSCTLAPNEIYCGRYYSASKPATSSVDRLPETSITTDDPTTTVAPPPGPTHPGQPNNCNKWHLVEAGDNCPDIADDNGISLDQFYAWNPIITRDCEVGFWGGYAYCVGVSRNTTPTPTVTPTETPTRTATESPTAPGPTQGGQPEDCDKWHIAKAGESCPFVADEHFITLEQFFAWNPAVTDDCEVGFWADFAYCVSRPGQVTTRSGSPTVPTNTPTPVSVPEPAQENNAVSNCNRYAQAQAGDWCSRFAERAGISLEELYAWNAVLAAENGCEHSFWAGYWYCTGVLILRKRIMP